MKIFRSFLLLISSDISAKLVNFLTLPIYLFYFQPSIYGTYVLVTVVIVIANTFTSFMSQSDVRFGQEEWLKDKSFNKSLTTSLSIQVLFVTIIALLLFFFSEPFYSYIKIEDTNILYFTILILYLNIFVSKTSFLNVLNKYATISSLAFVDTFFRLALIFILVTDRFDATITLLLSFYCMTYIVKAFIVTTSFIKAAGKIRIDFNKDWFKNQIHFSLPLMLEALTNKLLLNIDVLIINSLLAVESVGIYAIAKRMISYLNVILEKISYIYRPKFFSFIISNKEVELKSLINKVAPEISFVLVLFYNALLISSFSFSYFLPESYYLSILPFQILMAKYAFTPLLNFITAFFEAYKQTKIIFLISSTSLLINVVLDFLLIPMYGISGAAIASVAAIYFSIFIRLYLINKNYDLNFWPYMKYYFFFIISYTLVLVQIDLIYTFLITLFMIIITIYFMRRNNYFSLSHTNLYEKIAVPKAIIKIFKKIL